MELKSISVISWAEKLIVDLDLCISCFSLTCFLQDSVICLVKCINVSSFTDYPASEDFNNTFTFSKFWETCFILLSLSYYCDIESHYFSICFQCSNFTTFVDNSVFQFHRNCFELQGCFRSSSWSVFKSFDGLIWKQKWACSVFSGGKCILTFYNSISAFDLQYFVFSDFTWYLCNSMLS